jgi:hypothetical protein
MFLQHRYVDGVLRTLCGEAINDLVDEHFYNSATNAIIAETIGEIAPVAAEEALTEVRAQACRDQLIEAELEAWMRIIAEETLGELHGVDSQVRTAAFIARVCHWTNAARGADPFADLLIRRNVVSLR